jgi:hypothetical protein
MAERSTFGQASKPLLRVRLMLVAASWAAMAVLLKRARWFN